MIGVIVVAQRMNLKKNINLRKVAVTENTTNQRNHDDTLNLRNIVSGAKLTGEIVFRLLVVII